MDEYLCSYFLPNDQAIFYFKCLADDTEHAIEQLENAEPLAQQIFCEIYAKE